MLILVETPEAEPDLYRAGFALLFLRPQDRGFSLHAADGALLELAPQAALAIVAPPDRDQAERARSWAADHLPDTPVVVHGEGLAGLLRHLAAQRRAAARHATEARLQLAELRIAHAALEASHGGLAALLREQALCLPRPGFSTLPDPDGACVPAAARRIAQPIPTDIRTLCAIALHLRQDHPAVSLTLELFAADDDTATWAWDMSANTLSAGWTTFAFERMQPVAAGSTGLRLHWHGSCPKLSLGRVTLRPDRAAVIDGVAADRALALRVFDTLPGAAFAATQEMGRVIRLDGIPLTRIDLRLDADLTVLDPRGLHDQFHFQPVAALPERRHILVHPLGDLPTVARLPGICPRGTVEILARVETIHPNASIIEYGIHLAEADATLDETVLEALASRIDWIIVGPCEAATLRIELPAALQQPTDLLLLTRLQPGGVAHYGWAHFTGISLFGRFDGD